MAVTLKTCKCSGNGQNSNFIFSYTGRKKRNENEEVYKNIDFTNINKIVEPFSGSMSFSMFLWLHKRSELKEFHTIYNDTDPNIYGLFKYLHDAPDNAIEQLISKSNAYTPTAATKTKHKKFIYDDMQDYFNASCHNEASIYTKNSPKTWENYIDHVAFIKSIHKITNTDYMEVLKKYACDPQALIYLDPPYFDSFNGSYYEQSDNKDITKNNNGDMTKMLVDIVELFKSPSTHAKLVYVHNKNALMDYLFGEFRETTYIKKYQLTKKIVTHSIHYRD